MEQLLAVFGKYRSQPDHIHPVISFSIINVQGQSPQGCPQCLRSVVFEDSAEKVVGRANRQCSTIPLPFEQVGKRTNCYRRRVRIEVMIAHESVSGL